jgi:hypothetical protein
VEKKFLANHDHYPENDAEKIFWQHVVAVAATNLLKVRGNTLEDVQVILLGYLGKPDAKANLLRIARGE